MARADGSLRLYITSDRRRPYSPALPGESESTDGLHPQPLTRLPHPCNAPHVTRGSNCRRIRGREGAARGQSATRVEYCLASTASLTQITTWYALVWRDSRL